MKACSFRVFALLFLGGAWNLCVQVAADSPDHPHVALTTPFPGGLSEIVTVSALATDHDAAAGVQFLVDGQPIGAADTQAPYSIRWDTLTRSNGSYTLNASVRDTGGNLPHLASRQRDGRQY